jgi:hypothetical protein
VTYHPLQTSSNHHTEWLIQFSINNNSNIVETIQVLVKNTCTKLCLKEEWKKIDIDWITHSSDW